MRLTPLGNTFHLEGVNRQDDLCPIDDFRIVPCGWDSLLQNRNTFELDNLPLIHLISPIVLPVCDNPLLELHHRSSSFAHQMAYELGGSG